MTFKPFPCRSRWEAMLVASWVILIDILLVTWLFRRPVDWVSFILLLGILISLPLFVHLVYRIWGTFNLEYWFDRNALHIHWAASHLVIPLASIQRVIDGEAAARSFNPLYWPSPYVRPWQKANRRIEQYATRSLAESILIETSGATYAISPQRHDFFLEALQAYHQLGPIQQMKLQEHHPVRQSLARIDHTGIWLLVVAFLGTLFLFGILMGYYPALPERLTFHYNSEGVPDSIREKSALFILPTISALTFLVNSVAGYWMAYRKQWVGAYLLWGGTIAVQLLVLLALFSLMT